MTAEMSARYLLFVAAISLSPFSYAGLVFKVEDTAEGLRLTMDGQLDTAGANGSLTRTGALGGHHIGGGKIVADGFPRRNAIGFFLTRVTSLSSISTAFGPFGTPNPGDVIEYGDGIMRIEQPSGFSLGDVFAPRPDVTFSGITIDDVFMSNLDAGPIVLGRFDNGELISIRSVTAIPEPNFVTVILAGCVLGVYRRKRRTKA